MNEKKSEIRELLLDIHRGFNETQNTIDSVCIPILKIINDYDNPQHDQNLIHAVQCLTYLLADPYLLPIN